MILASAFLRSGTLPSCHHYFCTAHVSESNIGIYFNEKHLYIWLEGQWQASLGAADVPFLSFCTLVLWKMRWFHVELCWFFFHHRTGRELQGLWEKESFFSNPLEEILSNLADPHLETEFHLSTSARRRKSVRRLWMWPFYWMAVGV